MSSAKKIEEYFENEDPVPLKSQACSTPSRTEEIKQFHDLTAINSPSWSFAAKPNQKIPESINLDSDSDNYADLYKSLDLYPYPFSNDQRTKTHTILIKKEVMTSIFEKFPSSEMIIKRALLESLSDSKKYTTLVNKEEQLELTPQEAQKVNQLLGHLNYWVWRFQQLNSLLEPNVKFRTVEQILVYYYFHLYGIADIHYIRKIVGKGTSSIIALVQFTANQEPPFIAQSQVTELEKQRIAQEIPEKIELKKNELTSASTSFEQILELANQAHFREYKNHVLKLMRLKTRNNQTSEKNNSQTAKSHPETFSEEDKRENSSRSLFNPEGFKIPIILAETDSLDNQKSMGSVRELKIPEKKLGKRISSLKKVEEGKQLEILSHGPNSQQLSQDKQQATPAKEVKEELNLNKRTRKASEVKKEATDDGEKQIESIERELGEYIESYLKMTGGFQEAIQFIHEFQDSVKRQLEIGKYTQGDKLNIELKVKVERIP